MASGIQLEYLVTSSTIKKIPKGVEIKKIMTSVTL